jgi:BlaI family transcriptional regulator, penicillinase repressor
LRGRKAREIERPDASTGKAVDSGSGSDYSTEEPVETAMDDISFTPRELDVMSILWRLGSGTVTEVRDALEDDLAYTSVLSALQTLEAKGYVRHESEGRAYRYIPTVEPEVAGDSALSRIREAIYQGSSEMLFAQLVADRGLSRDELERMRSLLSERLKEEES